MSTIQFLQTTPEQLAELINDGIKTQLQDLKKALQTQEANDELLTREQTCQFL